DLKTNLRYKVLVERKGFAFFVELGYENLPAFCEKCAIIGHHTNNCKRYPTKDLVVDVPEKKLPVKKNYVAKNKEIEVVDLEQFKQPEEHQVNVNEGTSNVRDIAASSVPLNEDMAHNSNRVEDPVLQP
ncbi:hypothetical protein A2U01_0058838, partial [Trifolium medium]|nr:hypothetical protein [Trifolium medium]